MTKESGIRSTATSELVQNTYTACTYVYMYYKIDLHVHNTKHGNWKMTDHGAEFRAVEASGIRSEVLLILAASGVRQLNTPVWKFHKSEKGYGLSLFWRTGEQRPDTLRITPTIRHSREGLSTATVQVRGSNEARSECRSSWKGSVLMAGKEGLIRALLEFQRCQLLVKEGVSCQSASL